MKKALVFIVAFVIMLAAACEKKMTFYDHALALGDSSLILREDGTVWSILRHRGYSISNYEYVEVELVDEYSPELNTVVEKKNAEEMEAWEFALAARAENCVGIGSDGSVWIFPYADEEQNQAYKWKPVDEIEPHDGFWIEIEEMGVNPYFGMDGGETHPVVFWVLHDDSGELVSPELVDLEVLVGGEWYWAAGYLSDTLEVKRFNENGEFRGTANKINMTALVTGLDGGDENTVPVPSGHYRLKAKAYDKAYNGVPEWKQDYKRQATVEFDLVYKNGEYEIKNIQN